MADLTLRLVKGTELTFGELDANFQSLDSDIVTLTARFDSFQGQRGLDSAQAIEIITDTVDSAYVELMYSKIDQFRDSAFVQDIITEQVDSTFLSSIGSYTTAKHDSDTLAQVDSAYIQARSDHYMDSDVRVLVDSAYVRLRADSGYVQSAIDSAYIKHVVDSTYVGTVAGYGDADVTTLLDSFNGHIIPEVGETYDLGTNLRRWRSIYAKDAYVSLATIFFSDSSETPQTSLSIDSTGEFKVTSPSGVGLIAKSTTGNAFDSNTILSIIDSAYVQSRQTATSGGGLDSASTLSLIDSAYIQARQVDVDTVRDSAFITSIVDAAYVQSRQVDLDTQRDSAFINNVIDTRIDSTQFLATTATTTDVAEGDNLYYTTARNDSDTLAKVDSAYVQQRVRGPEMIAGGRIKMSSAAGWSQNSIFQKQLFGIWDSGQGPGGTDGIDRLNTGLYKFQFDSANLARITSGDDYTVMVTADYGADDPTASSRTVSVMVQADSSFPLVWERSDTGDQENYADTAHINFQVWLY